MKRSRHLPTVVAVGVAALLAGTAGVATGAGAGAGPWLLGEQNHAKSTTKLASNKALDKPTVKIENTGDGPALALVTDKGQAPFKVNSKIKVGKLNADQIDGLDSVEARAGTWPRRCTAHVLATDPARRARHDPDGPGHVPRDLRPLRHALGRRTRAA